MSADETAYQALSHDAGDGDRWAFGTGFDDPLAGVDTTVPGDVAVADLAIYCLMLGDDALIASHRLAQWCSHAPELEEELALANIALDLLGQARLLLARAGRADPSLWPPTARSADASTLQAGLRQPDEDALAYFRDGCEFRNVCLVELPNGDFARSTAGLLVFSTWRLALFDRLTASRDPVLAAVAAKGVKELTYHRDYAARWVVRLGDGTPLSRERMQHGLAQTWPYVDELFAGSAVERRTAAAGVGTDPVGLREEFDAVIGQVLSAAGLPQPQAAPVPDHDGRAGVHTAALGELLADMQSLARAHPEATW